MDQPPVDPPNLQSVTPEANEGNGVEVEATGTIDHAQVTLSGTDSFQRTHPRNTTQIETHENIAEIWTTLKLTWAGKLLELEIAESDRSDQFCYGLTTSWTDSHWTTSAYTISNPSCTV
jgi:hypothetical protein